MSNPKQNSRVDYKKFNSTGQLVHILDDDITTQFDYYSIHESEVDHTSPTQIESESSIQSIPASATMTEPSKNAIDMMVLAQEAMNMIKEVPINDLSSEDANIVIIQLQEYTVIELQEL